MSIENRLDRFSRNYIQHAKIIRVSRIGVKKQSSKDLQKFFAQHKKIKKSLQALKQSGKQSKGP